MFQEAAEWAHSKWAYPLWKFHNGNFMGSFSEQLIFNNYELMALWAHSSLWNESLYHQATGKFGSCWALGEKSISTLHVHYSRQICSGTTGLHNAKYDFLPLPGEMLNNDKDQMLLIVFLFRKLNRGIYYKYKSVAFLQILPIDAIDFWLWPSWLLQYLLEYVVYIEQQIK